MIDYQQIVGLVGEVMTVAIPVGLIFGLADKLYNAFMSMVFGKDKINL
jgi:hypothetical protein